MILRRLRVLFSLSAEMLGAAIIAHGTEAGDVTYVLSPNYGLLLVWVWSPRKLTPKSAQIAINPFHCSLQLIHFNAI